MRLIVFAIYLGIGAMLHAIFAGPHFDWSSAWTFGWLFGWPIMVVISFYAAIIAIAVAVLLVIGIWMIFSSWCEAWGGWKKRWRARRNGRGAA